MRNQDSGDLIRIPPRQALCGAYSIFAVILLISGISAIENPIVNNCNVLMLRVISENQAGAAPVYTADNSPNCSYVS